MPAKVEVALAVSKKRKAIRVFLHVTLCLLLVLPTISLNVKGLPSAESNVTLLWTAPAGWMSDVVISDNGEYIAFVNGSYNYSDYTYEYYLVLMTKSGQKILKIPLNVTGGGLWWYRRSESESIDISGDGTFIVAGCIGGVKVYKNTGELYFEYRLNSTINSVSISKDGKVAVAGAEDGIYIFDVANRKLISHYSISQVVSTAISDSGKFIACGCKDRVYVFDRNGEKIWENLDISSIRRVQISNNGLLAVSCYGLVFVFDVLNDKLIFSERPGDYSYPHVGVSPDGNYFVFAKGETDNRFFVVSLYSKDGTEIWRKDVPLSDYYEGILGIRVSNNADWILVFSLKQPIMYDKLVLGSGWDYPLVLFDKNGNVIFRYELTSDEFCLDRFDLDMTPDGKYFAVSGAMEACSLRGIAFFQNNLAIQREQPKIIEVSWSGSPRGNVFNISEPITFHIVVSGEYDPEEIDFKVILENEGVQYNLSRSVEYIGNQTFRLESSILSSAFIGIYDVKVYLYINSELEDIYIAPEKIYIIFESPTQYQRFICDKIYSVRVSDVIDLPPMPPPYPPSYLLLKAMDLLLAKEFELGYFNITSFDPNSIVWNDTIQDVNRKTSKYLAAYYVLKDVHNSIEYNFNVTGNPPDVKTIVWNFFFGGKNAGVDTSPTEDCAWWDTDEQIYLSGKGVCNDYSDLYISKVRSLNIPAKRVSGLFVENFTPAFHVWVETYIDDKWYLAEPTGGVLTDDFKYYAKLGYTVVLALTKEESETGETINVADKYKFSEKVILKKDDGNIEILLTNLSKSDTYYLILAYPTKHELKSYIIKNKTQEMLTVPKESLTVYLFSDNGCLIDFASTNDEPKVRNLVKLNTTITIPEYLIGFLNMGLIDEEEIKNMVLREIVIMKKLPYYVKCKMDKDHVDLTLIVPENDVTYFATKIKTLKTVAQSLNNLNY